MSERRTCVFHAAIAASLVSVVLAGCASAPSAEPAPKQAWLEIRTPNFWLISNAEASVARGVVQRLERFREVAGVLTGAEKPKPTLPTRVFLFASGWARFRADRGTTGYFLSDMEANYLAIDASNGVDAGGAISALHEYAHFLMRNQRPRFLYPTWYEEGFADAISTVRFDPEQGIVVGAIPPVRATWLARGSWLPLETVLTLRGQQGLSSSERAMFYAQSWLFVHRLTWGEFAGLPPRYGQMVEFVERLAEGEREGPLFREVFDSDYESMQQELRRYAKAGPPLVRVDSQVPQVEIGADQVRALPAREWLVHLCQLQLARGSAGAKEAERLARLALEGSPDDAQALVLLARAQVERGQVPDPALVQRALALAPENPAVVRGAARVGLRRLQQSTRPDADYGALAVETRDLYRRAVKLDRWIPAAHAGVGYTSMALRDPAAADTSLREAYRLAPWDLNLMLALGELHARHGRPEEARVLLGEVARAGHEEGMRRRAQQLLDGMK